MFYTCKIRIICFKSATCWLYFDVAVRIYTVVCNTNIQMSQFHKTSIFFKNLFKTQFRKPGFLLLVSGTTMDEELLDFLLMPSNDQETVLTQMSSISNGMF